MMWYKYATLISALYSYQFIALEGALNQSGLLRDNGAGSAHFVHLVVGV